MSFNEFLNNPMQKPADNDIDEIENIEKFVRENKKAFGINIDDDNDE